MTVESIKGTFSRHFIVGRTSMAAMMDLCLKNNRGVWLDSLSALLIAVNAHFVCAIGVKQFKLIDAVACGFLLELPRSLFL